MMPRTNLALILLFVAVLAAGRPLFGQRDSASLEGRVVDSSGAVVPLASVDATNLDTNFDYHTVSDAAGQWTFSPVRIGRYRVTVGAAGFKSAVVEPISLDVQQRQRVDLSLVPGAVSQSVEVLTNSPLLQTDTSERGQVIDNKTMVGLPLNGRNPVQLAQLTVGVTTNEPGARTTAAFGFSASGSRSIDNSFLLDGVDNNSNLPDLLNEANYVVMPPPDALQEFKIETGNYDSEFGRSTGAIVNAVTRSGSNQFHGVLYEFLRSQNLDALNYYDTALQPYHQNQFGATLGGPIVRNKLFFFGDYEGLRITHAQPITSLVPTAAQKAGDFSSQLDLTSPTGVADCNGVPTYQGELFDTTRTQTTAATASGSCGVPFNYLNGAPSNVIPIAKMDPLGAKLMQLFPAANATAPGYNYLSDPLQAQVVNQGDVRIDQVISGKDTAFYRFSLSRSPSTIPSPLPGLADGGGFFSGIQQLNANSLSVSESHVFSPLSANELHFGYNQQSAARYQKNYTLNVSQQIGFPGVPYVAGTQNGGLPQMTFNDASTLGSPTYLPAIETQSTYTYSDTFTRIAGKQTWKFGGEVRPERFSFNEPPSARGNLAFGTQFTDNAGDPGSAGSGLATLLSGQPLSGLINNISNAHFIRHTFALFLQDDWRITPTLSLNLGMRYEYFAPVLETSNAQSNFNPYTGYLDIPRDSKATLPPSLAAILPVNHNAPDGLVTAQRTNFSPRLGLAYQISPKLAAQSAFGLFFNPNEGGIWGYAGTNPPYLLSESYVAPCSLPSYSVAAENCSIPGLNVLSQGFPVDALTNANTPNLTSYQTNMSTPYVMQWHMTFQYQAGQNTVLQTAYVGSKGNKEYIEPNLNQATPTADPSAPYAPRRPYPYINASIYEVMSEGSSNYNGLQTSLTRRLSSGLSAIVNYTYSKALGDGSTTMGAQNNDSFRYSRDPAIEYGPLDFDVRHRFVSSVIYQLPFGQGTRFGGSANAITDKLIGHWTASGIVTLSSGNWFTVTDENGNFANSDGQQRPDYVPGQKASGKPCVSGTVFNTCAFANPSAGSFGDVSLNSVEGPGYKDLDLAVQKIIPLGERLQLELRGEMFNAFNHPNRVFAAPGPQNSNSATVFGSPSFGFVTAAQAPREIQVAGKLYF